MDGYDSNDLSGMVTKITSGATGALGKIVMTGYSSDNITSMTSTIITSTTNSLGNITMDGFDKDNIPSDITNSVTTGSNAGILLQPPMITEITVVTTPTADNTPSYTFSSTKAGTITYGDNCSSSTTSATTDNNTITFTTLSDGTHSNCSIYVTSSTGVKGNTLSVTPFTVDTTAPTANFTAATDNVGTVTGALTSGNTTDDTAPVLSGTNESGSRVKVFNGSTELGSATVSGTSWSYSATVANGTTYQFNVKETDLAGNTSAATINFAVTGDTTAPSVSSFTLSDTALKASETATVTLVFSEAVASFSSAADITADNGTLATMTSADNITWAGTFTPTANTEDDNNTLSLATSYTDTAGNAGPAATTANYAVETLAPTISSVTAGWGTSLNATEDDSAGTVTIVTSGAENGQTVTVALNGTNYTGTVSDNSTSVTVSASGLQALTDGSSYTLTTNVSDAAGNAATENTDTSFTYDITAPTVSSFTLSDTALKAGDNATVTLVFSEAVASFSSSADITADNGTLATMTSVDNITWAGTFTPTANTEDAINTLTLATSYTDTAGNTGTAATTANYAVDTLLPTLAETTLVPSLTNDNSTQYTFSSSEGGTISVGGSCSNSSDNNTALADNMTVSFAALADGTYSDCTITVTDSAGNSVTRDVNSFTIDTTAPTLAEVTAVTTPTNDNTSSYTFSSTEAGTISYSVCGGNLDNASADNNTIIFDALADGPHSDCKISVTDNASNTSDNLSVRSFTIDTVKPVLAQVTAVTTPTKDPTPGYAFSSDEAGTISYGGCSPGGTSADNGTNSISFGTLSDASYSNCTITVTDSVGNASSALSVNTFVVDTTAPTVDNVSSSTADGSYKLNDNITVTVTFSETVIVDNSSGNPRIQLETGTNDRYANYVSGNSTSVLSFLYTVQSGDNSSDLDYTSTSSLSENNGTIRDNATNNANLTLLDPGSSGSLGVNKAIVIDNTAPTVASISPTDNQSGVSISDNISVTFSESMDNTSVSTNTSNTSCSGSLQLSSDNFTSCILMSSTRSITNSDKTITFDPYSNLEYPKYYKIRVTTGVKDKAGNSLESQYETTNGFLGGYLEQEAYVKSVNRPNNNMSFGSDVTIYGDTMAVGAYMEGSQQRTITNGATAASDAFGYNGAVYVYTREDNSSWSQQSYIKPSNGPTSPSFTYFGFSISLDNNTLAVGAQADASSLDNISNTSSAASTDTSCAGCGAVFVYTRSGTNWSQQAYIKASNSGPEDQLGRSVAISGDTIVAGANKEDTDSDDSGAAYVFTRSGTAWSQQAILKASNSNADDQFGNVVDIDNNTIVVWAEREASNQKTITNGTGASSNNSNVYSGAVYVYTRSGTSWSQQSYIKSSNNDANDNFGYSMSIDGDTLAVSAQGEDSNQNTITNGSTSSNDNSAANSGAVYIYTRSGTNWAQQAYIKPSNAVANGGFGSSVSLKGDMLVVGARGEDSNATTITDGSSSSSDTSVETSGAVYVFKRSGTSWSQISYIKAVNSRADINFGMNVALDNATIIVGSSYENSNQQGITNGTSASTDTSGGGTAGAAWVYRYR